MDDHELLRRYVRGQSQEAFRELVARHLPMVYSVACRSLRDSHLAEDIAQAAFALLAQKAPTLADSQVIAGWLYNTARNLAMRAARGEQRRRGREQEAVAMQALETCSEAPQVCEQLEPAMAELQPEDRDVLVLRYLQNRALPDVGAELGITEDAARMRSTRALERLRAILVRQGITVPAAGLATILTSNTSYAVPASLAAAVGAAALATSSVSSLTTATASQATHWLNAKVAGAIAGVAILAGTGTYLVEQQQLNRLQADNQSLVARMQTLASQPKPVAALNPTENEELDRLRKNTSELLRLRNEVTQLRRERDAVTAPAAVPEMIWEQYSQVFARDLSGPERATERAVAFAQVMTNHPPIALIRVSPVSRPASRVTGRLQGIRLPEGSVSMGAFLGQVLRFAYNLDPQIPQNRIIVPEDLANARYDFIDTMPQGGREALQQALKDQFGLVARRQMRTNLILTVKSPAIGLHKHTEDGGDGAAGFRSKNVTMGEVANRLSKLLGVDVADQTQLASGFDFTLNLRPGATTDEMKTAILDQLGLQLTAAADGQQVEFLVAERLP
jgi:uncharacterized protein (TIGR03435 family)